MNERALRVLDFTKIRDMLAGYALSDPGKEKCRALTPLSDFGEVNKALDETEEAVATLAYVGGNPLISFNDVSEYLSLDKYIIGGFNVTGYDHIGRNPGAVVFHCLLFFSHCFFLTNYSGF